MKQRKGKANQIRQFLDGAQWNFFFLSVALEELWSIPVQQAPADTDLHWY